MTWTAPATKTAHTSLLSASDWNDEVKGNLDHLYANLPNRWRGFHLDAAVVTGNAIVAPIDPDQLFGHYGHQNTPANGDSFTIAFEIAAGSYTLKILGRTNDNGGKIDFLLDGVSLVTGVDTYSGAKVNNVTLTSQAITIAEGGRHVITGTLNGKNGASSNYDAKITSYQIVPAAD